MAIQCDVANHDNVKAMFERAINALGMVDVVIHAAGVLGPVSKIGDTPVEEWWSAFVSCEFTFAHGYFVKLMEPFYSTGDKCERSIHGCSRARHT